MGCCMLVQPTTFSNCRVLFVMAAAAEYGPELRARMTPLMTGVGPVEAAVAVGRTLERLVQSGLPDLVVSLGSAGSQKLAQAQVYQVSAVAYRDMDASAFGFAKGQTPFLDLPVVVDLPYRIPGVQAATLSTGGAVISGAAYRTIEQDMVDMETFAVLRACQQYGVPLIGLRGISDGVSEVSQLTDWTAYLHVIDHRLAAAVDRLGEALVSGALAL